MNQQNKVLNSAVINNMKSSDKDISDKDISDKDISDIGENRGLRVSCGKAGTKSFFYRYTSPITKKLTQIQIGRFPSTSLAEARVKLQKLKDIRRSERCPAQELKQAKQAEFEQKQKSSTKMTVKDLVEFYLKNNGSYPLPDCYKTSN